MRMLLRTNVKAAACAAALLSACGDRPEAAPPASTPPPLASWTSQRELGIRLQSSRDASAGEVTSLAVRGDTTLYSLHGKQKVVRVFGTQGNVLATIRGGAPGTTFQNPTRMGLLGEILWVYDAGRNRVSTFDRDFKHVADGTPVLERAGANATFESVLPGDEYLVLVPATGAGPDGVSVSTLIRMGPPKSDTILQFRERNRWLPLQTAQPVPNPFAERAFFAVSPDNSIVIAEPPKTAGEKNWSLTKITHAGDTTFTKQIPYFPIEITPALRQLEAARLQASGAARGVSTAALEQALSQTRLLPPITGLVVAVDGTILVRAEDTGTLDIPWTIVSPAGEVVATQTTPTATNFMAAGGPFFFGAERDADSVIAIGRYRVVAR